MFIADFYSPDPILTAFRLSRELQKRAKAEDEFKDAYMQLAGTIQTLTKYKLELIKPPEFGILKNRNFKTGILTSVYEPDFSPTKLNSNFLQSSMN